MPTEIIFQNPPQGRKISSDTLTTGLRIIWTAWWAAGGPTGCRTGRRCDPPASRTGRRPTAAAAGGPWRWAAGGGCKPSAIGRIPAGKSPRTAGRPATASRSPAGGKARVGGSPCEEACRPAAVWARVTRWPRVAWKGGKIRPVL